jgi:hypothetical protein
MGFLKRNGINYLQTIEFGEVPQMRGNITVKFVIMKPSKRIVVIKIIVCQDDFNAEETYKRSRLASCPNEVGIEPIRLLSFKALFHDEDNYE